MLDDQGTATPRRRSDFGLLTGESAGTTRGTTMGGAQRQGPANGPFREGFPSAPVRTPNGPVQQVSRMGVDPRSAQGQQIVDLLSQGYDTNDPMISQMIGDLVAEYQETLIGPLTKNRQPAPGDAMGPFFDREGNQFGYTTGDKFSELDNLSTENLARIQGRLVGLGLLDGYVPGKKDKKTVEAFGTLLHMANGSGHDWARELSDLERIQAEDPEGWDDRLGGGGGGGQEFAPYVEEAYLAPDYATLAQAVKGQLRETLGRDPDESEMALLTAELSGWDREAFSAEQAAARAEYDAKVQAQQQGTEGLSGGVAQSVDPMARFKESFEQKFKGELRGLERNEEVAESQEITQGAVSTLSQMAGGMG
jgi:hypothetical protein